MIYQNVGIVLNFVTAEGLSPEQAVSAVRCFLQQQGRCEPLPVGWLIGVPVEAEETAPWVKECKAKESPSSFLSDTPSSSPRNHGWLD